MANPIIPSFVDNSKQLAAAKRADQLAERRVNKQINNYENKQIATDVLAALGVNANLSSPQVANQVSHVYPTPNGMDGLTMFNLPNLGLPTIPGLNLNLPSVSVIPGVTLGLGGLTCTGVSNIGQEIYATDYRKEVVEPGTQDWDKKTNDKDIVCPNSPSCISTITSTCVTQETKDYIGGINNLKNYTQTNGGHYGGAIPHQIISGSSNDKADTLPPVGGNRGASCICSQIQTLLSFTKNLNGSKYADTSACTDYLTPVTYEDSWKQTQNGAGNELITCNQPVYTVNTCKKDPLLLLTRRGFSGPGQQDTVNSLCVLSSNQLGSARYNSSGEYDTDYSDIIAFYFHDLVNDRYIPFRATVKGINEQAQAEWTDINYIGRADKLYNYKGFSRTLGFNFIVVASSLLELMPMWQRINYLMTSVKPSGYTNVTNSANNIVSHFIIPPMMTVTIGNMYKEQPIVIDNIGLTIPDEAQWETLSENLASQVDWSYFNGIITVKNPYGKPHANGMAAQFPRVVEITIQSKLLEQTLPQMGDHNFGSYNPMNPDDGKFSDKLLVGDAPKNSKIAHAKAKKNDNEI